MFIWFFSPNMSYKPLIIKRDLEQIANGSIAFLIPQSQEIKLKKRRYGIYSASRF